MSLLRKASIVTTPTSYENGKILSVKPGGGENLIPYSEDFSPSSWVKVNNALVSATKVISPDGTLNASQIIFDGTSQGRIEDSISGLTQGAYYTVSVYARVSSGTQVVEFGSVSDFEYTLTTEWQRLTSTEVENDTVGYPRLLCNDTAIVEIYGFQLEQNSYATSYIPTNGAAIKNADFQFTRNSSATRTNSQGLIEDMQILSGDLVSNGDFSQEGSELITNGDFATDTNWTKGTGWSISGGAASCDGTQVSNSIFYQNIGNQSNKTVQFSFTISDYVSGVLETAFFGASGTIAETVSSNGNYTFYISVQSGHNGNTGFTAKVGFIGSIDNVSVKEVGQDWEFNSTAILTANGMNITTGGFIRQDVVTIGKSYKLTYDIFSYTSGDIRLYDGTNQGNLPTSIGSNTFNFIAGGSNLVIQSNSVNVNLVITNISVIEITSDTNLPRIDYTGGVGHWLFEPQSTNTATYSNDFTQGDIFVSTANPSLTDAFLTSQQATSPDGTNNAWKMVDNNDGNTGQTGFSYFSTRVITNNYNTISYFVKKQGSNNFVFITTDGFDAGANGNTWFDIQNGTLGNVSANHTANIENYGNGWYRISVTIQTVTDIQGSFRLRLATSNGATNILRDGTNGIYLFGVQAESNANRQFMTSYIPTNGSTVTRLADAAFGAGSSDLINSTEGVLYAEIKGFVNDAVGRPISISDGTTSNRINLFFPASQTQVVGRVSSGGVIVADMIYTGINQSLFNKIAVKYKENNFALWVNGVEVLTDTSGAAPIGLEELAFDNAAGAKFSGKTKCVAVFKEALNNDELECLTGEGYDSFNALALANNYTII